MVYHIGPIDSLHERGVEVSNRGKRALPRDGSQPLPVEKAERPYRGTLGCLALLRLADLETV